MAIGYTTVISKFTRTFFDDFLKDIKNSYNLFTDDLRILIVNNDGESLNLSEEDIKNIFATQNSLYLRFKNFDDNYIGCNIRNLGYLVTEEYSMDELLKDTEKDDLFNFVERRFHFLRSSGLNIGFIFDLEGYSENIFELIITFGGSDF